MNEIMDKRARHRRYSDRRAVLMLALYEILFDEPAGPERDRKLLEAILENYRADQTAFLKHKSEDTPALQVTATAKPWDIHETDALLDSVGIEALLEVQSLSPVSLSLSRVKRPSVFDAAPWEDLWDNSLKGAVSSLLSVSIKPSMAKSSLLWVVQTEYSREWNIRDRDLAEEVATLLAKAADRDIEGHRPQ